MHKQTLPNAVITVSLSALENNLNVIKNSLSGSQQVMAVVKANAYGHGDVEVAGFLADKVEWFAVNTIEEGVRLREAGIGNPILVFSVPEAQYSAYYVQHNLTATISDLSHFKVLDDGIDFHLNIDTGMGRLGILPSEVSEAVHEIEKHEQLKLTGLYTHFATADNPDSDKVKDQFDEFNRLRKQFSDDILVHTANTGGVFFYPNTHFDMVRPGIGIYGYAPGESEVENLMPALELHSKIIQVKELKKGESVSYGATWEAPKRTKIAIVPVGYEDGVRRNLSGKIKAKINGNLYPIIGTITMNFCMVEIGAENFSVGTEVELLNADDLTAKEWANYLGTIPYEVLTSLSGNILRSYVS